MPSSQLKYLSFISIFFVTSAFAKNTDMVLRLKEKVSMEELASNVLNPSSSRYGQFYTPEEIQELVAPTNAEYSQLLQNIKVQGFQVVHESKSHLFITVRGSRQNIEQTFGAQIRYLNTEQTVHEESMPAQIPEGLDLIDSVIGLDNTRSAKPHLVAKDLTGPGALSNSTVKTDYEFNDLYKAGLSGKGQHIAIAGYDGFYIIDTVQYFTLVGVKPAPVVDQIIFNGRVGLMQTRNFLNVSI